MKKTIFFLMAILNIAVLNAQEKCLTPAPEPPQWIFNKSTKSLLTSTSYSMNIFVHIVRSNTGQGLGTGILTTIINSLNSYFQDADIQFSLLESEFIDNDYYYVNFSGKESQLFGVNSHCNAIDIYVLGESTIWTISGYDIAGMAEDIPSTALIIHGDFYDTSSLPHEMGHCIGLYHTHHGTVNEGGDANQCSELVDGSNSTVCGDYISDTPADPNIWSSSNCSYIGTVVDANGDSYSPDATNLMSYARNTCRNSFSSFQINRMKNFIDNTTILQNVFHSIISSPSPSVVCSFGSTFSVSNLPSVDSIIWSTGPYLTVYSDQNTNHPLIKSTGNGNSWVSVRLVNDCGSITLPQETVWAGIPQIYAYGSHIVDVNTGMPVYDFCYGTHNDVEAVHPAGDAGITDWDWQVSYGQVYPYGSIDQYATIYPNDYQSFMLEIRACNTCGYTNWAHMYTNVVDCGRYLLVFTPNPTTGETTLSIESESEEKAFDESTEWEMEVYSESQLLKAKKTSLRGQSTKIQTAGWKEGVYFVRVIYKDEILTGKLVVKR